MNSKKRIILSIGIGPLYFMKSVEYLHSIVDIVLIQSWIPRNTNGLYVRILSRIIKHKYLSAGLAKRKLKILDGKNFSCAFSDFFLWGGKLISKFAGFPSELKIAGWAWKIYGFQSRTYIKDSQIFHVRSGAGQGGAIRKARSRGMKILVDHSIAHPGYMQKHLYPEYKKNKALFNLGIDSPLFQLTIKDAYDADLLVVNSEFVKRTFVEFGFPVDKIRVVVQGVRTDFFQLKKDYAHAEKVRLLFTGGFNFRKGAEYLLEALKRLESEGFQFEMHIVGAYQEATDLIEKYPLRSVFYHGFIPQDDLKMFLSNSDLYVFPSLSEGCASSGMEAMAAGLPVIATEESGLPITHKQNGLIIESKSSQALYDAIKYLSNDYEMCMQIGINAANTISQNYKWEDYAANMNKIYDELLT